MPGTAASAPSAWPLGTTERATLDEKVVSSGRFWSWRLGEGWKEVQQSGVAHLEARLGPQEEYWAIDGGRFPQIGASRHRFRDKDIWVTATIGLSAQRMPKVEQFVDDPATVGRIELVVARSVADDQGAAALSRLATIPFTRTTWFGNGHTVDGEPGSYPAFGADKVGLLLADDPPATAEQPLPDLRGLQRRGEPVTWLWVMAIDAETLALAQSAGSATAIKPCAPPAAPGSTPEVDRRRTGGSPTMSLRPCGQR